MRSCGRGTWWHPPRFLQDGAKRAHISVGAYTWIVVASKQLTSGQLVRNCWATSVREVMNSELLAMGKAKARSAGRPFGGHIHSPAESSRIQRLVSGTPKNGKEPFHPCEES